MSTSRSDRKAKASKWMPLLLAGAALLLGTGVATAQDDTGTGRTPPSVAFTKDAEDARGRLDIARVALVRQTQTLRAEVTMVKAWDAAELTTDDDRGPGSICWKLWTKRDPTAAPADYLVCLTANADGDELVGRVLRERANGLPKVVGDAVVTRPTTRSAHVRFARKAVGDPDSIRFAGEVVTRETKCPRVRGCVDMAPDLGRTETLTLR